MLWPLHLLSVAVPQNSATAADIASVMRQLTTLTQKVDKMALDFTAYDADVVSLKQEIDQLVAVVQASKTASADLAAAQAAIADRDATIKALRDQIVAALAPAPAVLNPVPAV